MTVQRLCGQAARVAVIAGASALTLIAGVGVGAAAVAGSATINASGNAVSAEIQATSNEPGFTCELVARTEISGSDVVVQIPAADGGLDDPDGTANGVLETTLELQNLPDGDYTVRVRCSDTDGEVILADREVTLPAVDAPPPPTFDFFGSLEMLFGSS